MPHFAIESDLLKSFTIQDGWILLLIIYKNV